MPLPVVSKKSLTELQEYLSGWTLREIHGLFASAEIPLCEDYEPETSGQRRTLVARYLKSVDSHEPCDTRRVLKVFELVFMRLEEMATDEEKRAPGGEGIGFGQGEGSRRTLERLAKWLRRDGFVYSEGAGPHHGPRHAAPASDGDRGDGRPPVPPPATGSDRGGH